MENGKTAILNLVENGKMPEKPMIVASYNQINCEFLSNLVSLTLETTICHATLNKENPKVLTVCDFVNYYGITHLE